MIKQLEVQELRIIDINSYLVKIMKIEYNKLNKMI